MPTPKNLMKSLLELDGAITKTFDPHSQVISSPSPSVNFIFGKGQGLPMGFSGLLYGPPKGGKSALANAMIGQLHQDYPDGVVVKFDTEFRDCGQLTPQMMALWGIDKDRYVVYQVNSPDMIYDRIRNEIAAACEAGLPIKMVIIDSINGVMGRRTMNADSVMTQQIGDDAKTNQDGLKMILPIQRKYGFALVVIAQQRAEMDMAEQMRGNKVKPGVAFGVQHHCEYFIYVEPNKTKAGKTDLAGNTFEDNSVSRFATGDDGKKAEGERTGHKIRVVMKDSSLGPKGRVGEFALDYGKGIINTHEEVFLLGVNRGIIEHPNNLTYAFGDKKWTGKPSMLEALRESKELQAEILKKLRIMDLEGGYPEVEESPE
jgi:hypothetical protein